MLGEGEPKVDAWGGEPKLDALGGDAGGAAGYGCWRRDQKWMPRETKDRVKGRTMKINKKRIGSDSCILWERRI